MVFDSRKEARRYEELRLLERAGKIARLRIHPRYALTASGRPVRYGTGRQAYYVADFDYTDMETGRVIVEDAKGRDTQLSALKRALLRAETGIGVRLV